MNAMLPVTGYAINTANLSDPDIAVRINAFVRAHANGTPFHLSGWSRAMERGCGQNAHYLVAETVDGAIVGVLPLTLVASRLFGRALVSSGFAVGGGVLSHDPQVSQDLLDAMLKLAKEHKCPTLELRGGEMPSSWHVDTETYLGFMKPLAADDDAELLAIPRKQRAEVRRALGFALDVNVGTSQRDRDAHFAVYAESVRNLGTPVFPKSMFAAVLDEFGEDADILTVRHEGRAIASVLSLYHNGVVMPYWGGGTAAARTWRANDLMYYALMCHARSVKGCYSFDFGRSKTGTGPAAFKRNWGFEGQPLSYAKLSLDGEAPRDINPLSPKYRLQVAAWQKLPLPIANFVGPIISRGLG